MQISLRWLKSFLSTNLPTSALVETLTHLGIEVDAVEPLPLLFSGVVVGRLLHVEPHPNAERLCVVTITDNKETLQVVCGDTTCQTGQKVALARIGAVLADPQGGDPLKIRKGKLRGVESSGMLCSAKELGLGEDDTGIMRLSSDLEEGTDLVEIYGDTILHLSLTPNLNHCASTLGIARELAAATGEALHFPKIAVDDSAGEPIEAKVSVAVHTEAGCPRYACRLISGVTVAPSPTWLQQRLASSGVRSINNIVDITNYVLMEMGHPLHAFDYGKLSGRRLQIDYAKPGQRLTTLDGIERPLTEEMLVISDGEQPIALAGIMGGSNSEVSDATTDVLLESAYFQPRDIRRAAKKLGLTSEASKRFERGADPNAVTVALDRATQMILDIAGGHVCRGMIDIKTHEFRAPVILCRLSRINKILGTHLSLGEVTGLFHRLGFSETTEDGERLHVCVPTYRADIKGETDLIEEVARLYGYNNIPKPPVRLTLSQLPNAPIYLFERQVRQLLIGQGLQEFITCDLISESQAEEALGHGLPKEAFVHILNPSSVEQSVLRASLLPGMLQALKYNYNYRHKDIHAFEVGRNHFKHGGQYREQSMATICLMGRSRAHHWDRKPEDVDFYDLKGIVENLLKALGVERSLFQPSAFSDFHPGRQASLVVDTLAVGTLGEIHPSLCEAKGIDQRVFFAEINLHDLFQAHKKERHMHPLPQYPGSERDWTVTMHAKQPVDIIFEGAHSISSRLLHRIVLLDVYTSEKLGQDKKNVTVRFLYQDPTKTLSFEAVEKEHARMIEAITKKLEEHIVIYQH